MILPSPLLQPQSRLYFFQAEDGIRDVERSRGLGDVYKRQKLLLPKATTNPIPVIREPFPDANKSK